MTPISLFYGMIIYMYTDKSRDYKVPHIHAAFKEQEAVLALTGEIIDGGLDNDKLALVRAWLIIHFEDLNANWNVLKSGNEVFRIEPLR